MTCPQPVEQSATHALHNGVPSPKGNENDGKVGVRPTVFPLENGCEDTQRLAVDVVNHRHGKQQNADPPAQPPNGRDRTPSFGLRLSRSRWRFQVSEPLWEVARAG